MMDVGYAAEFSCPFFATTGFEFQVRISASRSSLLNLDAYGV
jgi:hypothetical protein